MRCQNCGREMKNGARFCIGCGAQHDENGQLVNGNNRKIDYNKTMMASNSQQMGGGNVDYNKTMMSGNTGFRQYQPQQSQQPQQSYQQNYQENSHRNSNYGVNNKPTKKLISPIMIICPIIIVGALAYLLLGEKIKNKKITQETKIIQETKDAKETKNVQETKIVVEETTESKVVEATKSESSSKIHLKGYWSADANYFYIDNVMQKDMWIVGEDYDYYVGPDGKKYVSRWTEDNYYVDATGKKAKNQWIEWSFTGEDGKKKIGYYYVGEDGRRVTNQTIDGKKLNDEGCWLPNNDEKIQNETKNEDEKESLKEETVKEKIEETTTMIQTTTQPITQPVTTTIQTTAITIPPTTIPMTQVQTIAPTEMSINAILSDGKSIAYQKTTQTFSNEKITKYESVFINDANMPELTASVNEWNTNHRSHLNYANGELINSDTASITQEIKVERNDGKIFSLCETKTKLDNNKAFYKTREGKTWDAKTGELLDLETLCNGEEKYKSSIDEDTYNEMIEGEPEAIFEYCIWYMSETGITFVFDSEQINSTKIDGLTFTLKYSESGGDVNKLLPSKYRK